METIRIITTSPEIMFPRLKRLGKIRVRDKSLTGCVHAMFHWSNYATGVMSDQETAR